MSAAIVQAQSNEQLECTITTRVDPGLLLVDFTFTTGDYLDGSEAWTAGSWGTPVLFGDDRWRTLAVTPVIGSSGIDLAAGTWWAWVRVGGPTGVVKATGIVLVQ